MSRVPLCKTALSVALLSVGFCAGGIAQAAGTTATATQPSTAAHPSAAAPSAQSSTAMTADKTASRGASDARLARGERNFIEEAAKGGMAEVQLGQLAATKGQSDQVKQFGQKMVDDHGKANEKLKQLAASKGVELPADIDRSARREHDKLSKLSGADFDREYMKHMVSDHKKDVKDFEREAKAAKDPDVKTFASDTLPTLQQHLQLAQQADAAVRSQGRVNTARTSNTK
jgi:putative membrane protein